MPKKKDTFVRSLIDVLMNDRHRQTVMALIGEPSQPIDIQEGHHA
jgi:hypothetical protein